MTTFKEMLMLQEARYKDLLTNINRMDNFNINGGLQAIKRKSGYQYYHRYEDKDTGEIVRVYLNKNDIDFIRRLADKSYYQVLERLIKKRLKQLIELNEDFEDDEIEAVYESLPPARKAVTTPIEPTWEMSLEAWRTVEYKRKSFNKDAPRFLTKKGEWVRSKSEKIMADTFFDLGIEYKYECP